MAFINKIFGSSDLQDKFIVAERLRLKVVIRNIYKSHYSIVDKIYIGKFSSNSSIEFNFINNKVIVNGDLVQKVFMGVQEFELINISTDNFEPRYKLIDKSGLNKEITCKIQMNSIALMNTSLLFVLQKNGFIAEKY